MKRSLHILLLTLVTLITWRGQAHAQLLSPGKLSAAHADIDTDDDCSKCHESGKKVVAALCTSCHKDLAAEMAAGRGWHSRQAKGKSCESCHVEHLGRNTKLIRWPGGNMNSLDHKDTGWPLEGKHTEPTCVKCHPKTSPLGKTQFIGTKTECLSCHKDPHKNKFGSKCQSCHNVTDWDDFDRKAFDHNKADFKLVGKHVPVPCEKCHNTPPKWKGIPFATCDACHKDPHNGTFKPKACTTCHTEQSWDVEDSKMRGNHPWLSLANGHAPVKCEKCHDKGNDKPPSKGKQCVSCHPVVHEAPFGKDCNDCHRSIKWMGLPDEIGRKAHPKTKYPLEGKHVQTACAKCHLKSMPENARYRKLTFNACAACHKDQHAGEFAARRTGECAQCHTVKGFTPTLFGVTEHATTAFVLDGKHVATPCSACHTTPKPRVSLKLEKKLCVQCHDNPHGDQFAKEMAKGGCAQCHSTASWGQPKIDHSTWPLTGAHGTTACARCHGDATKAGDNATFRGVPRECEGCHEDKHAGQFTQNAPVKKCTDCHTSTKFKVDPKIFDHVGIAHFPLTGNHAKTTCDKCHRTETLRNGETVQRFRLGYRLCKDCHANPHSTKLPRAGQRGAK